MDLKLEIEYGKADLLKQVDNLKDRLDALRPLPEDVEGRVMQKLRLDWNYHSNAIEGNRLNHGETVAFLMEGITAKGKPLKDHLDIRGHNEAINFLLSIVKESRPVSEADIRALHQMILVEPYDVKAQTPDGLTTTKTVKLGEYKTSANHVKTGTGEMHYYASPKETPAKMHDLMTWYAAASRANQIHPVVLAALFHHKFVAIHPFDDGNGRLSRILMNLILMQNDFPPVVIKTDDRSNYYSLLSQADAGNNWPFVEYIAERAESSLKLYLKAVTGGEIEEDDDIDKELALLKLELKNKVIPKKKAGVEEISEVILQQIFPLIKSLSSKLKTFDDFFETVNILLDRTSNIKSDFERLDLIYQNKGLFDRVEKSISRGERIHSLILFIELLKFKNPDNVFDIITELEFEFLDEEYSINNAQRDIDIFKFYNEELDLKDNRKIVKSVIDDIKSKINDHFKQQ